MKGITAFEQEGHVEPGKGDDNDKTITPEFYIEQINLAGDQLYMSHLIFICIVIKRIHLISNQYWKVITVSFCNHCLPYLLQYVYNIG